MKKKELIIERVFDAPVADVWRALTVKELMKQWYIDTEEFRPEVGFKFQFAGGSGPERPYNHLCEVLEVVHEQKLSYDWRYEGYEGRSILTFELFPDEGGTKVKLTHTGLETFPDDNPDLAITNFEMGWNQLLDTSLKNFLEPDEK